ncbi:MAG: DNA polymerase I [Acutalibacteraceae bacterium]
MKLLVVDGNSILNRAYYGIRPLVTKDGQFTNAIYGFFTMLNKIENDTNPDRVAIAFDLKEPTFRHKMYDGYKSNRKGMPEELHMQMAPLKELLTLLGYKIVTAKGYEADDILGTFAKACEECGNECVLATGDRDSLQLVSEKVTVRLASTKGGSAHAVLYDEAKVFEDYGVKPEKLIDIKAIQGDSSDCIPGVAGIGPKGAGDLISRFGSIEYIYDNIDTIDIKDGIRKKLKDSKDNAFLSKTLGEIKRDIPIDTDLEHYKVEPVDKGKAAVKMAKLELFSLIEKYNLRDIKITEEETSKENNIIFPEKYNISQITSKENIYIFNKAGDKNLESIWVVSNGNVIKINEQSEIKSILKSSAHKNVYSSKEIYAYGVLENIQIENIDFDVTLGAYLLNPSAKSYDMERLTEEYGISISKDENFEKQIRQIAVFDILAEKIKDKVNKNNQQKLLEEIEIPLAKVLAEMEYEGFAVDKSGIEDYGLYLGEKIEELQQSIYSSVGEEFNINSPKQLGVALFEKLGLPPKKKTKSGYSTNAEVLESLRYEHPVVDMVLQYRTLSKLKSTYCDGLLKVVEEDGRIHSSFNQTETRTGRISSTEPNLQNIPVRTDVGRELRKFFCAKEGYMLVDADYSQIELRVLAHISGDKEMCKAFRENVDIHTVTASEVFNMPADMVTPKMRRNAKAVNFGIVYGIGAFSLGKDIGVSFKEAKAYINSYLSHYSGVDRYMKEVVEKAKEDGYVETMFGRRRYLPELLTGNHMTRSFGERVARNMPIQGTAADIIKIAMIKVSNRLKEEGMKAKLILQVHDELIVECPMDESMMVAMILQDEMEKAVSLLVPLVAEASVGKTWYDAKN